MPENTLRVVARIKARADKAEEVRELLSGLVELTCQEVGCLRYELLQNRKDPTDFTFVEEWQSESAFEAHSTSAHIKAVGPKLREIVMAAPDIQIYSVIA